MSAQVIRLANSAYFENNARVESIEDAIVSIGINNLKRWIFLMEFSRNDNAPEEVLRTTYQRAIMCKKIAEKLKRIDLRPNDAYFIGLFSTLDILTGKLLVRELSTLNITDVVKNSLIYREGVGGTLLNLVKAYEEADFTHVDRYCETLRISREDVYNIYYDSIGKASKLWKDTTELGGVY
jgi:EAL and modified HD-GYP domain-containing signal transduction protein